MIGGFQQDLVKVIWTSVLLLTRNVSEKMRPTCSRPRPEKINVRWSSGCSYCCCISLFLAVR